MPTRRQSFHPARDTRRFLNQFGSLLGLLLVAAIDFGAGIDNAHAACEPPSPFNLFAADCSGDLSDGIVFLDIIADGTLPTTLSLNVHDIVGDITPNPGQPGILFLNLSQNGEDDGNGRGEHGVPGFPTVIIYAGGSSTIFTEADPAPSFLGSSGIIAISAAGDGGNSGSFLGIGSDGADGAIGGDVTIDASGAIVTNAANGRGIAGISIGGSGGSGGGGTSAGDGGAAGSGGEVRIRNDASILTRLANAQGIWALSVGGNGGAGGNSGGIWSSAGGGERAARGGLIRIGNTGAITTDGDFSEGILAQSIGGFGGDGGNAGGLVAFGGNGASAGGGGRVIVENRDTVETDGKGSHAILAQSIGGGGGRGGSAGGLVALGDEGDVGGVGGTVTVDNYIGGDIHTLGEAAYGIYAQSVGGGGGDGGGSGGLIAVGGSGTAGGAGGIVGITNAASVLSEGNRSHAIFAQSVGGGGGNGGAAIAGGPGFAVAIGGKGGTGGNGGTVTVNDSDEPETLAAATVVTRGLQSNAIFAQSIGGGGGNGGLAVSGTIGFNPVIPGAPNLSVAIGGDGGNGGNGGAVTLNHKGLVQSEGDLSNGVFAQSVGGGGGTGGGSIAANISAGPGVAFAMGGSGGAGGNGGAVTVTTIGRVTTQGHISHGIVGQSIGGGGGSGGYSLAAGISAVPLNLSLGGSGGLGGNGNRVSIDTRTGGPDGDGIETLGDGSMGILAQSVGGGGGSGGLAGSAGIGAAPVNISLGGGSSEDGIQIGAIGGRVDVDNAVSIATSGINASGIFAQSVGGGGGNGGGSFGAGVGIGTLNTSIGGSAGFGGAGSQVTVTNTGAVRTEGVLSYGILAQSVGGGGGNGGSAHAFGIAASPPKIPSANIVLAVGGVGGLGGNGGDVRVDNTGAVETLGDSTHAVFAQSVGGSGGNGGYAAGGAISIGSASSVKVTIGGNAAAGGSGGRVTVGRLVAGDVVAGTSLVTHGDGANAIHAQSIGGGGGDGGFAGAFGLDENFSAGGTSLSLGVTVGGSGALGGRGDRVEVYSDQFVRTYGDNASGIFAQSIGGGGGNGGSAVSALATFTNNGNLASRVVSAAVAIGGQGGAGGSGRRVRVENEDMIVTGSPVVDDSGAIVTDDEGNPLVTAGGGSHGIYAQSIGGGGGVGGRANAINVVTGKGCGEACAAAKTDVKLTLAVGGKGGAAGDGGMVDVENDGEIVTFGDVASGIFAQSIGGGGGDGGNGSLGTKDLLPDEFGVVIPLISKDNTKRYSDLSVGVGGSAAAAGDGGSVSVVNHDTIRTFGDNSDGVFAQSVGGGGGVGGRAAIGVTGTIGIGGEGGAGGNGGNVTVDIPEGSLIETFGTGSFGVFAQSVGGGGGIAGSVDRFLAEGIGPIPDINLGIGAAFARSGGAGGNGGNVTVNVEGTILTHGDGTAAVFAQSVGGGGGLAGDLGNDPAGGVNSWAVGSAGAVGHAGKVIVNYQGDIETRGAHATAMFIQSHAGSLGISGGAEVELIGSAVSHGLGSVAILAHAEGPAATGDINILLSNATGMTVGGASDENNSGVGVYLVGGAVNTLTSRGLLATMGGVDRGYAVAGEAGGDTVLNFGTLIGSLDLGEGANSFVNQHDAFAFFGEIAGIGTGNVASNFGWMSPGGPQNVMTTVVASSVDQDAAGTYGVDLDLARTEFDDESDMFQISEWASFAGTVDVTILNAGSALPGEHEAFIARTADGLTDNGTALVTPPSAVATYSLESDSRDMWIAYGIDFAPDGLNANNTALGEYINEFQTAGGSPDLEPLVETLYFLPDLDTYAAALDQLTPEPYVIAENAAVLGNVRFGRALMDCPQSDHAERDSGCVWFQGGGEMLERSETSEKHGTTEVVYDAQIGIGGNFNEHSAGLAGFSYSQSEIDIEDLASASGRRFEGGIGLSRTQNDATFAIAALGGAALYDVERHIDFVDESVTAKGDQNIYYGGGQLRLAYNGGSGVFRFVPIFEAWGGYFHHDAVSETGAGPIGLDIDAGGDFFATVRPALTLAAEVVSDEGAMFRPYLTGGFTYFVAGTDMKVTSTFQGEANMVPGFATSSALEDYYVDAAAGFDLVATGGAALRLEGSAQYAEDFLSYGGRAKLVAPF